MLRETVTQRRRHSFGGRDQCMGIEDQPSPRLSVLAAACRQRSGFEAGSRSVLPAERARSSSRARLAASFEEYLRLSP